MNSSVENICVDLDGTLVRTDTLVESILLFIKRNPLNIFRCLGWLRFGKAGFKHRIANELDLDPAILPYNQDLLNYLKQQGSDKKIYLCTAANRKIAEPIATHLGIFASVFASDESGNLKGAKKAEALNHAFGEKGYIYAGNDSADLAIWKHASGAIVVSNSQRLLTKVKALTSVLHHYKAHSSGIVKYLRAFRLHQWVKNVLIFLPLILAHKYTTMLGIVDVLIGFIAFGLIASANYISNDLLDLESDRRHATKKDRPFASGDLSILTGIMFIPILLMVGFGLAYKVELGFLVYLLIYLSVTLFYSYFAKSIVILDIIVLAILYTIRLIAGAAAIHEPVTFWLLAYSLFIFFSLASVKRYAEVVKLDPNETISGRGYTSEDTSFVKILGISSGLISVLVFALYINDPGILAKYKSPTWLWIITPILLYWITRVWHLTYHGKMHEDPVVFALKDKVSYIMGGLIIFGIFMAV